MEGWHDKPQSHSLPGQTFSMRCLFIRTLHCWLPQASVVGINCSGMVPEVCKSLHCLSMLIVGWSNYRCDARPENLDNKAAHRQSHERSDFIISQFDPGIVWLQHGIWSDVIVSIIVFLLCSSIDIEIHSHSHMGSLMQTYTRFLCQICSIKSSRGYSKIILWNGSTNISITLMARNKHWRLLKISIGGEWSHYSFMRVSSGQHISCSAICRSLLFSWWVEFCTVDGWWFKGINEGALIRLRTAQRL